MRTVELPLERHGHAAKPSERVLHHPRRLREHRADRAKELETILLDPGATLRACSRSHRTQIAG
jgi:hypothetical protein